MAALTAGRGRQGVGRLGTWPTEPFCLQEPSGSELQADPQGAQHSWARRASRRLQLGARVPAGPQALTEPAGSPVQAPRGGRTGGPQARESPGRRPGVHGRPSAILAAVAAYSLSLLPTQAQGL